MAALLALSACGAADNRTAGDMSPAEAQALDDAAAMIESERPSLQSGTPPQPGASASAAASPTAAPAS